MVVVGVGVCFWTSLFHFDFLAISLFLLFTVGKKECTRAFEIATWMVAKCEWGCVSIGSKREIYSMPKHDREKWGKQVCFGLLGKYQQS